MDLLPGSMAATSNMYHKNNYHSEGGEYGSSPAPTKPLSGTLDTRDLMDTQDA